MTLGRGNAAKRYCLLQLEALARERERFRILDLGAGDAANFVPLLRLYPQIHYVGVEPDAASCRAAERNLAGLSAEIVNAAAYEVDAGPADAVASFSVFEHVYDRPAYLRSLARNLAPDGRAFVNYDAGHFVHPIVRDRLKTLLGPLLARAGGERWYQAFVREATFRSLAAAAGLEIVDAKSFNTDLKLLYRIVPEDALDDFVSSWLEFELRANELVGPYEDVHAGYFMTRNFVLRLA